MLNAQCSDCEVEVISLREYRCQYIDGCGTMSRIGRPPTLVHDQEIDRPSHVFTSAWRGNDYLSLAKASFLGMRIDPLALLRNVDSFNRFMRTPYRPLSRNDYK